MFVLLTGVPGSGKTYYAVYQIWLKMIKKKDYLCCFTNIGGFNFGISESIKEIKQFDSDIKNHLSHAHKLFLSGKSDDEINEYLSSHNLTNCLIVIDEAQIYFDKEDKDLVFWLTYHRHFFQDIILITQNILLIHYKYRKIAEFFIKAKQRSLSFSKSFTYSFFVDEDFKERVDVVKLPMKKEVFSLYRSGDSVKSKNFLRFWFIILSVFFVLLLVMWFLFQSFFSGGSSNSSDVNQSSSFSHTTGTISSSAIKSPGSNFLFLPCDSNYCYYSSKHIDISIFKLNHFHFYSDGSSLYVRVPYSFITKYFKESNDDKKTSLLPFVN